MTEVLGVIASTSQLAKYCGQVWSNEAFHTLNIQNLVESILASVSVVDPSSLLQRPWIPRTLSFLIKKGDFIDAIQAIEAIEKKKSTLSLHMNLIQAEMLNDMKTEISAIDEKSQKIRKLFTRIRHPKSKDSRMAMVPASSPSFTTASTQVSEVSTILSGHLSETQMLATTDDSQDDADESSPTIGSEYEPVAQGKQDAGEWKRRFADNMLMGNGLQINGAQATGFILQEDVLSFRGTTFENNFTAPETYGNQINGMRLNFHPDAQSVQLRLEGAHIANKHAGLTAYKS
ncbi:hypothetical protein DSL72_001766 [Monilinia vaccinii-corymbosi]|uniref:Uncharacterized protein n=1 Tax=Monilinia vaccinii-corymbosi TaxID=61207 RepID=A0A8A3PAR8_9HELO|nr:hypothetical protein DSL72_001766 [Monilinia vaccinii-corymbosi]